MSEIENLQIAEIAWQSRQPENINFLRPHGFRFLISRLPNVTYFCQSANIPEVSLGVATRATPFVDHPVPGEKLVYSPLSLRFIVHEDMLNYIELYDWMTRLGFPVNREQFASLKRQQGFRMPATADASFTGEYSDCTLLILNSNNLPVCRINFANAFPVSLSALEFNTTEGSGTQYLTAVVNFRYDTFTIDAGAI